MLMCYAGANASHVSNGITNELPSWYGKLLSSNSCSLRGRSPVHAKLHTSALVADYPADKRTSMGISTQGQQEANLRNVELLLNVSIGTLPLLKG